ncbi:MAG: hypothetical protein Q8P12_02995 [bacterium]|nr:hypothetical protein [bacterium]
MIATQIRKIEYERPWLYPKQRDAFFNPSRYSLIESSTKSGKTVGMMAWLFEQAIKGTTDQEYWWTAPVYGQAEIAFRRFKHGIPRDIGDICKWNESDLFIRLPIGTVLRFKSGEKPDNLYGENVWALAVDEASRFREEAWHALRTTLTYTKGPARIVGNVKGRKNWFYRMARKAESGDPEMSYHKITAYDAIRAGVLMEEEILQAQKDLPEGVFRELYLAEASDDEGNPFGIEAIRDCITPLSRKPPLYGGIDLAKSVDWTVIIGLDEDGAVSYFERFQKPWRETEDFIVANVGFPCFVDSTGVGDPIVEGLQRSKSSVNFESFKFTSQSKQQLMEALVVAVQKREIGFPDGPIVQEMENFEYEYTRIGVKYCAPEGLNDDTVCALALAVKAKSEFTSGPLVVTL